MSERGTEMTEVQKTCAIGDFEYDECENPATVDITYDDEKTKVCRECYEALSYAKWESFYRGASR